MEAPKFKPADSRLAEAQGFGQPDDTLTEIQLRQITAEDIAAANDEPPQKGTSLEFPDLDPSMLDTPPDTPELTPLLEDDNFVPKVVRRNVPEDPKKIAEILSGTNFEISPNKTVPQSEHYVEKVDPATPSSSQLETVQQVFAAERAENLGRVIPASGPLGEPTTDGEVTGRIDTASILPPEKVTFPTDRTPAGAYLNSPKTNWQLEGKGFAPEPEATNSTLFSRIRKLFG